MEAQPVPTPSPSPEPRTGSVWPTSAQASLVVVLVGGLALLAGRAFLQALEVGTPTIPAQRIDLNSATVAELNLLPGIGEKLAQRIVTFRADAGPFRQVDDLRRVPGLGSATIERLRPNVVVSHLPPQTSAPAGRDKAEASGAPAVTPRKGTNPSLPININLASAEELRQIPGIGPKLSERIVAARGQKPFLSVDELRRVPGIGPKILEKTRPFVTVGALPAPTGP